MDTVAAAAAVAKDAVVVMRRKIGDFPVGEICRTAALELQSCYIRYISLTYHLQSLTV